MTMLITKFHKLIQNKVLWLVFLVFIVFSFVIWGTQVPSGDEMRSQSAPGSLDGKPIDRDEFEQARYSEYLALVMAAGQPIPFSSELREEMTPLTWRRLVSLREAKRLGLMASNNEVVGSLTEQPIFNSDGRFDQRAYQNFVQGYLGNLLQDNIPIKYFEEHIRRQLSLGKLQHMVRETILTTPFDAELGLRLVTDTLRGAYIVVRDSDIGDDPEIGREEAQAYFDRDPAAFTISPKVRVKYVTFRAADFLHGEEVDPAEIEAYYTDNIEDFAAEPADAETETEEVVAQPETAGTTFRPLDEVQDEIEGILRRKQALTRAVETAGDFLYELMPDREGNAPEFDDLAADRGLSILNPDPFRETDVLPDLGEASADFVTQAFQLQPNREEYVSNPVEGEEAAYVLALDEQIPERIPTFEEVESEATAAAKAAARSEAVMTLAGELRERALAAAAEGRSMAEALEDTGLEVVQTDDFSFAEGLGEDPYAAALFGEFATMNASEVSDPVPVQDGILVVQLLKRTPAESFARDAIREQIVRGVEDDFAARIFPAWQDQLLADAHFEDLDAARTAAAEAAEEAQIAEQTEEEESLYDDE